MENKENQTKLYELAVKQNLLLWQVLVSFKEIDKDLDAIIEQEGSKVDLDSFV